MGNTLNNEIVSAIETCTGDLAGGKPGLEARVRAYDLLDRLLEVGDMVEADPGFVKAASAYCSQFSKTGDASDPADAVREAEGLIAEYQGKLNDARFEAAAAASLHEFAKEVFEIWRTEGIFARRRALRELRERAGFRLESHRIGNYVAKTFDLMNEAQARFASAQQALFAADVRYKLRPGTYEELYKVLEKF